MESVGELFPFTLVDVGVVEEPGEEHEVAAVHEERQLEVGVAHSALESWQERNKSGVLIFISVVKLTVLFIIKSHVVDNTSYDHLD